MVVEDSFTQAFNDLLLGRSHTEKLLETNPQYIQYSEEERQLFEKINDCLPDEIPAHF